MRFIPGKGPIPVAVVDTMRHGRPVRRRNTWEALAVGALFAVLACNSATLDVSPPNGGVASTNDCTASEDGCDAGSATDAGKKDASLGTSIDVSIQVEPGDYGDVIKNAITGATSSIHMTMYLLTSSTLITALTAQKAAGIEVKVVLNHTFPTSGGDDTGSNDYAFTKLTAGNVDVVWASDAYTYTHAKTIVIDGTTAIISTMNLAYTSPTNNREYIATDTDAADVADCEKLFAADYAGTPISLASKLTISPTDANENGSPTTMIAGFIASATKTLDVEVQSVGDKTVNGAIIAAQKAGIKVRVMVSNYETETTLSKGGVSVQTLTTPYIHAKAVIVDGAKMWMGSQNFTTNALTNNREVGLFTTKASEIAKVQAAMDADFKAGRAQ